ncbi:hypothetical protein KPL71_021670 [Citrus sinensis]|uniref:Uncharacterized protein n=1 Tax=Citrus sinensis TaxID=2711 RepID=A0ACB8JJM5_CITSI|nr:hypothetical protein KPL71_021670 [Citrus sinensis]
MRAILIQQGLDAALEDNQDSKAKKGKEEGSSSSGRDMKTINKKAHSTIILHLSDEVLREMAKEKFASGLWVKLEDLFLKKSLAKRLYMKKKLYTFSMKDGTALKDHLDELNKLILDLENVNIILEYEDRALILLSSLPNSYEHFVDTLLYGRQSLTLKDVKDALESKDLNKRTEIKVQNLRESLIVKSKPEKKENEEKKNNSQKDKAEKKKKKRKCYFCQKEGHYIKDCFKKKKLEKIQKESTGKAVVASEDEGDSEGADVLVANDKYTTGNNLACKIAGIGTVSLKMYDGMTRDLKQVRFVPDLRRNLISLGMIDQLGCSIKAENGQIEIIENGVVIMKGIRRNGLYVLVGSLPQLGVTTIVTSDKTKLWHIRLGHISERGLKELDKQGLFGHDHISQLEFCERFHHMVE